MCYPIELVIVKRPKYFIENFLFILPATLFCLFTWSLTRRVMIFGHKIGDAFRGDRRKDREEDKISIKKIYNAHVVTTKVESENLEQRTDSSPSLSLKHSFFETQSSPSVSLASNHPLLSPRGPLLPLPH